MAEIVVPIAGESIKIGQFLKLASAVATGGEAKELIAAGRVMINETVCQTRGEKIMPGDRVQVADADAVFVVGAADDEENDFFDEATADDDFDPEKWRNL